MFTINNIGREKCRWICTKWNLNNVKSVWLRERSKKTGSVKPSYNVIPQPRRTASDEERQKYDSLFPIIVKDLTELYHDMPQVTDRYVNVLQYNIPNHRQAPGLAVLSAYKAYESPDKITPETIHMANILGWCTDLLLCSFQINEDMMDGSETRRGLPCWYRNLEISTFAITDAMLITNGVFILLKKYCSHHKCYIPCMEWIHKVNMKIGYGQALDTMNRTDGKPNLDIFTRERHNSIGTYKGGYSVFMLPIKLVLYLAVRYDDRSHQELKTISSQLGQYMVAQNDILDCYGDPKITGKVGSDIREGKCTWLIVTALERASAAQKEVLKKYYGRPGSESEMEIRSLYEELDILNGFLEYEENSYNSILRDVHRMKTLPEEFFQKLVDTTFGHYAGLD